MKIPVILVDDHAMVRAGLEAVLAREPDLEVVGRAADGEEALALLEQPLPGVAVVDVSLPRMTGIELTRKVVELGLPNRVVLLSMHKGREFVLAALEAGALGYIAKDRPPAELAVAIRAVAAGQRYLSEGLDEGIGPPLRGEPKDPSALSARERDVLRLVARGLSSKEIAELLDMAPRTVEWYRATIAAKLKVSGVAGLVKYALKHHLATLDE